MMSVSQKCQYGLRAMLQLAKSNSNKPVTVAEISAAQAIPPKFLELILGQLRQGGYVESRRGVQGGYLLSTDPSALAVGEIIRFIDGPLAPVKCVANTRTAEINCPLHNKCSFITLWERARDAVANVYDNTTFQDLLDEEHNSAATYISEYCI